LISTQVFVVASSAFVHGVNLALLAGAGVLIVGAAFVAVRAPRSRPNPRPTPASQPATLSPPPASSCEL
jgi:hypothetical protein